MSALESLPQQLDDNRSPGWWGMMFAVATEATVFATLLSSYFYLRFNNTAWPLDGIERPKLMLTTINTVILVGSSFALIAGERAIKHGHMALFRAMLALTTLMGVVFLCLQGIEYQNKKFGVADNAYGSAFYGITGFHAAHVVAGLLMLGFLQWRAWRNTVSVNHHLSVRIVSLYWHFVDVVWLFVFTSLYLSEHF
jgi:cytochrome c oxidase subunit III